MNSHSGSYLYWLPGEFFSFSGKIMKEEEAGKKAPSEEIWPELGDYNI